MFFGKVVKGKWVNILGDPGAVSRVDKMFVVKVYCKIETSPWALTLTEPVPEAFELPAIQRQAYILDVHVRCTTSDTFYSVKISVARVTQLRR